MLNDAAEKISATHLQQCPFTWNPRTV